MPQTRSALSRRAAPAVVRRLVGALAATGLATTLGWAALASPAAQASDDVTVSNVTTTSEKAETWATVNLTADWSADHPTAGQTLTVTLGDGLKWPDGLDFKLINKDAPDVSIGDCAAAADTGTLTCTLNKNVEQWNHVDGSLWAHGQLTDQAVGKTSLSVTVNDRTATVVPGDGNGDGTCDAGCGGVTAPPADKDTHKSGWFTKKEDGTYTWTWDVNVNGSKEYTVVDHNATFQEVACTDSDWTKSWKPENVTTNGDSVHWTVPSADTVCHARYTTQTTTDSASNTATVNDKQYDATTDAQAIGGGDGVGLLGEAQDLAPVGGAGHVGGVSGVDVAEGGRGAGGLDPDGDHPALLGQEGCLAHGTGEGGPVGHRVVGGEGPDNGVAPVAVGDDGGGQADSRHGVARGGLGKEVVARDVRELVCHGGDVGDTGDDRRRGGQRRQTLDGVLQEAATDPSEV